ncbi:MAG: T9SS type A sorting domain-containing protein [Cytophagaceae bacterium]|nr:T9SS type A sorting domain-containing protein [Cytophagaceae bacterium]
MNTAIKLSLFIFMLFMSVVSFATAFSVTSIADAGAGTLRQAIINANADLTSTTGAPHLITFSGAGIGTITLATSLPAITNHVSINGGTLGTVIINGGNSAAVSQGILYNAANCSGSVFQNMVVNNCGGPVGVGVYIQSPAISVTITNSRIGTNAAGSAAVANQIGLRIDGAANGGHTISNNVISGNIQVGLILSNTINNTITMNYVGLNVTGATALGNTGNGIFFNGACDYNTLHQNVVSANTGGGILLSQSSHNTITGNYCGVDQSGMVSRGNQWDGIGLINGSNYNMIGGKTTAARNVCSGGISSIASGIAIKSDVGATSSNNTVLNNYCGVGSDGTTAIGNANYGIYLGYMNATNNVIGIPGFGNVIANNVNGAVYLENAGTINNSIRGNSIYCNGPGIAPAAGQSNVGIQLNTANTGLAAPVISNSSMASNVYGAGLSPGDTVDLYYIDACRGCVYPNGKTYIGMTIVDATGAWSYTGGVTLNSNVTATVTKYNGSNLPGNTSPFSPCSVTLPVTLVSFTAFYNGNQVDLNWVTATEINNRYFNIERSLDGKNFEAIGKVDGAGNHQGYLNYDFVDPSSLAGVVYYRLKQVDIDGTSAYSAIRVVSILSSEQVIVYPTPANVGEDIHVVISNHTDATPVTIELIDMLGKIVLSYTGVGSSHVLHQASLAKGIYLVIVKKSLTTTTIKIIIH